MRRPQFTLKTWLWLMVVVACFFAGAEWGRRQLAHELDVKDEQLDEYRWAVRRLTGKQKPRHSDWHSIP
jgi:hypothetical protein